MVHLARLHISEDHWRRCRDRFIFSLSPLRLVVDVGQRAPAAIMTALVGRHEDSSAAVVALTTQTGDLAGVVDLLIKMEQINTMKTLWKYYKSYCCPQLES